MNDEFEGESVQLVVLLLPQFLLFGYVYNNAPKQKSGLKKQCPKVLITGEDARCKWRLRGPHSNMYALRTSFLPLKLTMLSM